MSTPSPGTGTILRHGVMTMSESNPEKVVALLRERSHEKLCDDCIAQLTAIQNRIAVAQITHPIGLTSDFVREKDVCDRCGATKYVIQVRDR